MRPLGQRHLMMGLARQTINSRDFHPFYGGLNLIDSLLTIKPGQLLTCKNYEPYFRGGYQKVRGFERFDGRAEPHAVEWSFIELDSEPTYGLSAGDVLTWPGGSGIFYREFPATDVIPDGIVVYAVTGDLPDIGDTVSESGPTAVADVAGNGAIQGDTGDDATNAEVQALITEYLRDLIQAVPGAGPVVGIGDTGDKAWAIRDNVGGTKGVLHYSSTSGWTEFTIDPILKFKAGSTEISVGDTVTGDTSGATADVIQIAVRTGIWASSNAEGTLALENVSGTFQDGEDLTVAAGKVAEADGAEFTPELAADQRWEFHVYNFYSAETESQLYFCSEGGGPAYRIMDDILMPIYTGMEVDEPYRMSVHNGRMFLFFDGNSMQTSGVNDPMNWSPVLDASEIIVGGRVTNVLPEINEALVIMTDQFSKVLFGRTSSEYRLASLEQNLGAVPWTAQKIGPLIHMDQRGITSIRATDAYGSFRHSLLSNKIQPLIDQLGGAENIFGSQVNRSSNVYRLWLSDGRAIVLGFFDNDPSGFTTIDYDKNITALWSGQAPGQVERLFFGSDDGYVYRQDVGTSFDGKEIESFMRFVFHNSGSPERNKRYRKATIEMEAPDDTTIKVAFDTNYGEEPAAASPINELTTEGGGGFWNIDSWNKFNWSGPLFSTPSMYIEMSGFALGMYVYHKSATEQAHVLKGLNVMWSPRRLKREF